MNEDNQGMDPQEASDVTAASGQSDNTETQNTATEEATTLDGGEATEEAKATHPWEADERFKGKTPDDMFKIVQEADKYKGELSQKAKLTEALTTKFGLTPERMSQILQEREAEQKQAYYEQNPLAPLEEEVTTLKQEIAMQKEQAVIQTEDARLDKYLSTKPEFADFREDIRRLGYTVERDSDWGQIAEKYFGRALAKGSEAAYKKMGVKQVTQSAGVSKDMPKGKTTLDDFSSLSSAEMEVLLQ